MDFSKTWACLKSAGVPGRKCTTENAQQTKSGTSSLGNHRTHSDNCLTNESSRYVNRVCPKEKEPGVNEKHSCIFGAAGNENAYHLETAQAKFIVSESSNIWLSQRKNIVIKKINSAKPSKSLIEGKSQDCYSKANKTANSGNKFDWCNPKTNCSLQMTSSYTANKSEEQERHEKDDMNKEELPNKFIHDPGSNLRNGINCPLEDCDCQKNDWSPFLPSSNHDSDDSLPPSIFQVETFRRGHYDETRSSNEISERSFYSTESDISQTEYDFVAVDEFPPPEFVDSEETDQSASVERPTDIVLYMPSVSPSGKLVASIDGYKTAPNSIASSQEDHGILDECNQLFSDEASVGTDDCKIQQPDHICKNSNAFDNARGKGNPHINGLDEIPEDFVQKLQLNGYQRLHRYKYNRHDSHKVNDNPEMPTPQFLSVESIQYEADPTSGKARSVGKGSFGQVFKARFADPAFQHLPIVVKEFDEAFTSKEEIIEEARRLLYLRDTGYVPICYGLLCMGHSDKPVYGIVQEYIGTGLTLEQLLWDHFQLEPYIWIHIGTQCCEGLSKFHTKEILLNDIKSNNIILDFNGEVVRIKYIDFGLATGMRGKRYKNTKSLEEFVYLAPEVRLRGAVTNIASDIYSLGYMLDQIGQYSGVNELRYVAGLCMDTDPGMRLPVKGASSLLQDQLAILGYHYLPW